MQVDLLQLSAPDTVIEACKKPYKNEKSNIDLVNKIINTYKHQSVAEHIILSFNIKNISRLCLQELVRHRIASYTVESTRYTLDSFLDIEDNPHYMHIDSIIEHMNNFMVMPKVKDGDYREMQVDLADFFLYSLVLIERWKSKGYKADVYKYFLPESYKTELVVTFNFRSFLNFIELRHDKKAHFEIRKLAKNMIEVLKTQWISKLLLSKYE